MTHLNYDRESLISNDIEKTLKLKDLSMKKIEFLQITMNRLTVDISEYYY